MKIAIINYGMGNLRSVEKAFAFLGFDAQITSDPDAIRHADKVVLPGVGAFGDGMRELEARQLTEVLYETIQKGKPFLGVCLGLQLLFESSEEAAGVKGLGIIPGYVKKFSSGLKVPHMGWNQIKFKNQDPKCKILEGIPNRTYFYFVHSYYVEPGEESAVVATTDYGIEFVSMISRGNLFATQFHPEKSHCNGLELLRNFANL